MSNQIAVMPYDDYKNVCDAVRAKTGKTAPMTSGSLAAEINGIEIYIDGVSTVAKTQKCVIRNGVSSIGNITTTATVVAE